MRKTRPVVGVGSLPGGAAYYDACLRWYLTPTGDVTALTLHQLGRQTVDSLLAKIDTVSSLIHLPLNFSYSSFQ